MDTIARAQDVEDLVSHHVSGNKIRHRMCYRSASRSLTFTDYAFDVGTAGSKVATIWFLRLFYYFMSENYGRLSFRIYGHSKHSSERNSWTGFECSFAVCFWENSRISNNKVVLFPSPSRKRSFFEVMRVSNLCEWSRFNRQVVQLLIILTSIFLEEILQINEDSHHQKYSSIGGSRSSVCGSGITRRELDIGNPLRRHYCRVVRELQQWLSTRQSCKGLPGWLFGQLAVENIQSCTF